jgi:Zn-dependent protease
MDLSPEVLQNIVAKMIILILSICVHEFGHAFVADRLGDRLPRTQGRVTLNPLVHADPIGTLALPAIGLLATGGMSTGFGWGRPVQISPGSLSRRFSMRTGHMMVAAAGPLMNLLFGTFIAVVWFILVMAGVDMSPRLTEMIHTAVLLNYILMFFNLLPAPPLDGGAVIAGLLPRPALRIYEDKIAPYGIFIVAAFILIPTLAQVFIVPAQWLHRSVVQLLALFA